MILLCVCTLSHNRVKIIISSYHNPMMLMWLLIKGAVEAESSTGHDHHDLEAGEVVATELSSPLHIGSSSYGHCGNWMAVSCVSLL